MSRVGERPRLGHFMITAAGDHSEISPTTTWTSARHKASGLHRCAAGRAALGATRQGRKVPVAGPPIGPDATVASVVGRPPGSRPGRRWRRLPANLPTDRKVRLVSTAVLVLNCGSSSLKFAVIDPADGRRFASGIAERVGTPDVGAHGTFAMSIGTPDEGPSGVLMTPKSTIGLGGVDGVAAGNDHAAVLAVVLARVQEWARDLDVDLVAVGHRVVHGGEEFGASTILDDKAIEGVRACIPLAPLHNPANLAGIEASQAMLPDVPHVAVFDTAFHQSMPPVAYRYAVPPEWVRDYQVRRYGFHGTSHRYVSGRAAQLLAVTHDPDLRVITAHLGNGCSLTAVKGGLSVDTSMGLTPLEGVVMGTRSGDLDPGILGYIAGRTGQDVDEITDALNKRSGLLGLSGRSNDMRELEAAAEAGDRDARVALEVFVYRLAKYIASLTVPLGGLDILVFTGGIGENSTLVRAETIALLGHFGLRLDPVANAACVRGEGGRITVQEEADDPVALVVPTDEELVIARDAADLTGVLSRRGVGPS